MYQQILVPVDGSNPSLRALEEAIGLGKLTKARLHLFHVIDELSFALASGCSVAYTGDILEGLRVAGQSILQAAESRVRSAGLDVETSLSDSFKGRLCDQVLTQIANTGADLIVLGSHGRRGVQRMLLGSDAERILRVSPLPVLLLRAPG